jgi:LysM repeat protein
MAAKKASTRKYRQAKQAAKPAAKAAFPGKKQAAKRDPKLKISLEDKQIADEVRSTAKSELGKNAYLSKSEYNMQQAASRARFREAMREEFGEYGGKKASPAESEVSRAAKATSAGNGQSLVEDGKVVSKARAEEIMSNKKKAPAKKKAAVKKPSVAKPGVDIKNVAKVAGKTVAAAKTVKTAGKAAKSAGRAARSAANKAAWKNMTPEERKNWKSTRPGAQKPTSVTENKKPLTAKEKVKASARAARNINYKPKNNIVNPTAEAPARMPKEPTKTTPTNVKPSPQGKTPVRPTDASLRAKEDAYLEKTKARLAAENKAKANSAKGKTQTPQAEKARVTAKPEPKKVVAPKKGSRTVRASKFIAKKFPLAVLGTEVASTVKGSTFKDLNEINRLKAKLGDKPMSAKEGAVTQASNLANLATMGLVGKTRRERMDELNAKIKKKEAATAKANKGLRYGKGGESLVPGTAAYKAGSKTRPTGNAAPKTSTGAGGSTTRYEVKKGDTLSGIAKNAGLSLSEIRALNPKLMNDPKYKKGAAIWSGTKVNVKKK